METDLLGPPYLVETLDLEPDFEGAVDAHLVRRPADQSAPARRAVLHVHGYNDYFFHTEYAEFWTALGYDFYGIDLRKCGRSIRAHQTPYFVSELSDYYEELNQAWELITGRDAHQQVVLSAHSTGGLTASLWAHDRQLPLSALVLNAPWFDMKGSVVTRTVGSAVIPRVAAREPMREIPRTPNDTYGRTISADFSGEWSFDTEWKRVGSWPLFAGWLTAIRRGQRRVHGGLAIDCPILVLTSQHSSTATEVNEDALSSDIVLDVGQIRRWAPQLGNQVTLSAVPGALHDVVLSRPGVRKQVYAELGRWLSAYGPADQD